jgi:hypothetical protein
MSSIQVLGYAEAHPCTYLLDASYPRCMASPAAVQPIFPPVPDRLLLPFTMTS